LLDTDIVVFFLRGQPRVIRSVEIHASDPKAISVITHGELTYGALKSERPAENLAKVRRIAEIFPIIDVSRAIMETFGSLKGELERKGKRIDDFDLILGSTALHLNYTVVTNNERHFRDIPGLGLENWARN
jgi:tRNA(fMet)-specific endonuclease VapC